MTARADHPQIAAFAAAPSGGDPDLIARRREAAAVLDEIDRLTAERDAALADDVRELLEHVAQLTAERDALRAENVDLHTRTLIESNLLTAERDRFRKHSVLLNSVAWRLSEIMGRVPDGAERIETVVDPLADVNALAAERDELADAVRAMKLRGRWVSHGVDVALANLTKDGL